ncbi:MAG: AI-2E family transporter [Alphaproteobacteria bacterium]|nr:MAG: AI-2E family transporter [Alphaproteobacteria bacterium]
MLHSVPDKPWRQFAPVTPGSALVTVLLAVVVVSALYFGREVLVPIALAILLSFVLAPLVRLLQACYVPRILAVMFAVAVAFAAIFALGGLMISQVNQLAKNLPYYESTLRDKIQSLRGAAAGTGTLERASEVLHDLSSELDRPNRVSPSTGTLVSPGTSTARPIPVEIKQPDPGALQTLAALITPLIHPLATTGIVAIFVFFVLMQRQDLRNRLVRLAGSQDLQRTTAALDDAGQRLSRLFLTQLALNAGFGLVIGAGLWFIGVPSAPLWGILAMILRFVPYIGAAISAIFPLVLAAAVGPDWTMVLWTAALFLIAEPLVGHVIEPLLTGHSTGLSPVAVIASATFWAWLWGPVGLILATPLTVCLVVLGRHVDRLKFLDVMFGDQPALSPAELVYQRLLARDPVEAAEQAQKYLEEKPLLAYYQEVLIEGLKLAQADAERGALDHERMLHIRDAVDEQMPLAQIDKTEASLSRRVKELPERWRTKTPVLCVPGSGLLDEAVALIVAQLVARQGIGARAEQADALSMSRIFSLDTKDVALVCLCYLENATSAQIRYAVRRLRRKTPDAFVLVTMVGQASNIDGEEILQCSPNIDFVKQSLSDTVDRIFAIATSPSQTQDPNVEQSELIAAQ